MAREIKSEIGISEGTTVQIEGHIVKVKGKAGETSKVLSNPNVKISNEDNKIIIKALKSTKREVKLVKTFTAHIKNMLKSANEGSEYILKVCSGHFPMSLSVKGNELIIKNFFGEKIPRILKIKEGANVKVEDTKITVQSASKELSSQVAADIEQLTKRTKYDSRIFQDGCYIVSKDGKEIK
ncbi:MAG: 50S ribosomal protein L6 [Nanoarchaeota archaeon]|nr:50S ribosomal protein L6 [Nanoarchaeota archaeon]